MKILLPLLIAFLGFVPFAVSAYTTADTVKINELNVKALDLVYSNPKEGLQVVKETIRLSRKVGFVKGEIMAIIRRGIIFDVTDKPEQAIESYNQALQLARKEKYRKGEGAALNNIGLIYMNQHKLAEAMTYFHKAHDLFIAIRNDQMLSSISNNIGMIYEETNRPGEALKWFRKGLVYTTKANNLTGKANIYASIADVQTGLQNHDSAIYYGRKAIEIHEKLGNAFFLGKSYNNMALVLRKKKQPKEAESYYLKSLEIAREIENAPMLASTGFNLSQLYKEMGQSQKEGKMLKEIYPLISKEMPELAYKICLAYARWNYHHGSVVLGDTLTRQFIGHHFDYYNKVNADHLNEIEKKYEVEKKEQENLLLKKANELKSLTIKKNQQNSIIANFIWASGVFLLILLTLLIVLRFRKKNFQKELENQKAVFEATLAERKRISFDLHDNVGSQLSYVVNNLELLNQHSKHSESPDSQRIERTFKMSQEAIDSLRDTVWALHNSAITVEILISKLESFARKVIDTNELKFSFQSKITANKVISPEHTMHIFRIFQESVNNALKHAEATSIQIYFQETADGKLILEIHDNGKGIEHIESPEGHYGLKNMSDRAQQIGATWRIGKTNIGGTSVYLEV